MDEIILFQSLMDAYGLTLNGVNYAKKSTFTVTKEDVNNWWNKQTSNFKKTFSYLSFPALTLLMVLGESDFFDFMENLSNTIKDTKFHGVAEDFLDEYANKLSSAQQNSVLMETTTKKYAYSIQSDMLSDTQKITSSIRAGNQAKVVANTLKSYLSDVMKVHWVIDWDNFNIAMRNFLTTHDVKKYRYIHIASGTNGNQKPSAKSLNIYLDSIEGTSNVELFSGGYPYAWSNTRDIVSFIDISSLHSAQKINNETYYNYYSYFTDSSKNVLFTRANSITAIHGVGATYTSPYHTLSRYFYDYDSEKPVDVQSNYRAYWSNSKTIDRTNNVISTNVISKDVIATDQTLIGITSDTTDDADDRVFIMNAESVEELANTKAVDYPEVLPKTIAGSIVGVGTDVKSAVDTIRDNNPEYPYIPETPISDTTGNSLFTLYNVTTSELSSLADYLWSTDFIDSFKKFFSEPSDSLISLVAYPVDVKSAGAKNIKIGYSDSGVSSHVITDYIQEFDLGSITIPPAYNNFLDNNPYTKVHIYLPFIGSCPLDADLVVGSTLRIKYRVELLTGNCMALITVSSINGTYPVYQFNGNLGMQFPLSSGSYASIYKNLITTGITTASAIASGGALTPLAVASVANTVINSKANVSRSGNISGSVGYCGIMKPYVLVERPVTDIPSDYAKYNGVVTNRTLSIGSLHGYCVMDNVDVSTVPCTESEREEIIKLLMSGFYI